VKVDYICYISRNKVDQLHAQLEPRQVSDIKEQVTSERASTAELNAGLSIANILNLFKGGITYGRKNVIQIERKVKVAYIEKLQDILLAIAADHGDIPDLNAARSSGPLKGIYYYYSGLFHAKPLSDSKDPATVATIYSVTENFTLTLDCSLRYFSENTNGFLIHSGNQMFFQGIIELHLGGVMILLGQQNDEIFGTPLYLQLTVPGGDQAHLAL
jgi:hypothetical protein